MNAFDGVTITTVGQTTFIGNTAAEGGASLSDACARRGVHTHVYVRWFSVLASHDRQGWSNQTRGRSKHGALPPAHPALLRN